MSSVLVFLQTHWYDRFTGNADIHAHTIIVHPQYSESSEYRYRINIGGSGIFRLFWHLMIWPHRWVLIHSPLGMSIKFRTSHFQANFDDWWLGYFLWNRPQLKVIGPYRCCVSNGSGNGLVPSSNKPLPEPMLTQIYGAISPQWIDMTDLIGHPCVCWWPSWANCLTTSFVECCNCMTYRPISSISFIWERISYIKNQRNDRVLLAQLIPGSILGADKLPSEIVETGFGFWYAIYNKA